MNKALIDVSGAVPAIKRMNPAELAIMPKSMNEIREYAQEIASSGLAPKSYRTPSQIAIAIASGLEVGLKPLQSLQYIAVINGRPTIWGDGMVGIVQASGLLEEYSLTWNEERSEAVCTVKRRGSKSSHTVRFGFAEARDGNLMGKQGPWQQFPKRMCQWRARSWAFRDVFADVLMGLTIADEMADHPGMTMVESSPGHYEIKETREQVSNPFDDDEPEVEDIEPEGQFAETGQLEGAESLDGLDDLNEVEDDQKIPEDFVADPVVTRLAGELLECNSLEVFRDIMAEYGPQIIELDEANKVYARQVSETASERLRGGQ
jgi:hypothetical protein